MGSKDAESFAFLRSNPWLTKYGGWARLVVLCLPAILLVLVLGIQLHTEPGSRRLSLWALFFPISQYSDYASTLCSLGSGRYRECLSEELEAPLTFDLLAQEQEEYQKNRMDMHDAPVVNALEELHYALETMQTGYFQLWLGTWPDCIDWTGAVLGTYMGASLFSLTRSIDYILPIKGEHHMELEFSGRGLERGIQHFKSTDGSRMQLEGQKVENEINKYFSQAVSYYFGEDAFSIRLQAFDDMLWVVLGWLENIRFINLHAKSHYPKSQSTESDRVWYGQQFTPAFAHRARVFYDLAKNGWDTNLCSGGMNWNPYLKPYKNAITNELFISASVGMYLYFPGDDNGSPFVTNRQRKAAQKDTTASESGWPFGPARPHDPQYLRNAVKAYDWLKHSNMTNDLGLYVDGFHIRNWGVNGTIGTGKCDERNEMVYTYNQGVILSGLRSLWEATGDRLYLQDGHQLVRNVLNATGWDIATSLPRDRNDTKWQGLGRAGILEDHCDASGKCSQDGQTFKGIFFHHLTLFCEPLPSTPTIPGVSYGADKETAALHAQSCREYAAWVAHNAVAAMTTRDAKGRFGMWWGAGHGVVVEKAPLPKRAVDYRNWDLWHRRDWEEIKAMPVASDVAGDLPDGGGQWPYDLSEAPDELRPRKNKHVGTQDLNDRGRGRTAETQGGGVAVLRAMWEFVHMYRKDRSP